MRAHLDIKHEGTLDGDSRVRMQIDSESTAFLMSILTDLYSDPELAVIREYSTNALDSHRASGNTVPIEVELPSALRPLFIVRDKGLGMSVDDITHHFSKYGWSSKRDTDAEVGMLGLGCKSGLTYSSQFTLVAIKNGVKATVLVTREADGAGAIQVIDTAGTTEPDGVEVQIPVKSALTFNSKAADFFRFWEPGTVMVNGEAPAHLRAYADTLTLDPDVVLTQSVARDYIVMGNVPYPIDGTVSIMQNRWRVVAWVPIGSVDFTPSREALHMTKRSKDVIATVKDFVADRLHRIVQEDIDAAETHWDALNRREKWSSIASSRSRSWTYRGEKIPWMPIAVGDPQRTLRWHGPVVETASERPVAVGIRDIENSVFLVGHNGRSFSRADKERTLKWLTENDLPTHKSVFALPEMVGSPWFDGKARVVTVEELRGYKVEAKLLPAGKIAGRYRVLTRNGELVSVTALKANVIWIPAATTKDYRKNLMRFCGRFDDVTVVPIPKGQEARFVAENPGAMTAETFVKAMAYLFATTVTPARVAQIMLKNEIVRSSIQSLWEVRSQVLDPELAALVEIAGPQFSNTTDDYSALLEACRLLDIEGKPVLHKNLDLVRRLNAVQHKYPLLEFTHNLRYRYGSLGKVGDFARYCNLIHSDSTNPDPTDTEKESQSHS